MRWRARRCRGDALLVIVPRHPQRFDEVAALLRARGFAFVAPQRDAPVTADMRVVLGDSMGEMLALLRRGRRRVRRRQPAAAGRAEPDRADRAGRADARRSAHVQFRGRDGAGAIEAGAALRVARCRCADRERSPRCCAIPARRTRCATRRSRFTPRIAAPRTGCGRGSTGSRADARRIATSARRSAGDASQSRAVSPSAGG